MTAIPSTTTGPTLVSPIEVLGQMYLHDRTHSLLQDFLNERLPEYRLRVGLEEIWSLEAQVVCPLMLANREACVSWDSEVWYARLSFRCDLSFELADWDLYHELCELQTWRSAQTFADLAGFAYDLTCSTSMTELGEITHMKERQRIARNQEIEWRIYGLTGLRRPGHLLEEEGETTL